MINNCANCKDGRMSGKSMVYCTFYGINIRYNYNQCKRHNPKTVEVENETDRARVHSDIREEKTRAG